MCLDGLLNCNLNESNFIELILGRSKIMVTYLSSTNFILKCVGVCVWLCVALCLFFS